MSFFCLSLFSFGVLGLPATFTITITVTGAPEDNPLASTPPYLFAGTDPLIPPEVFVGTFTADDTDPGPITGLSLTISGVDVAAAYIDGGFTTFNPGLSQFEVLNLFAPPTFDSFIVAGISAGNPPGVIEAQQSSFDGPRSSNGVNDLVWDGTYVVTGGGGSITSDPHVVGPRGERFDFLGEGKDGEKRTFTLFSTPQFAVRMDIKGHGKQGSYIDRVAVLFRNETIEVGVYDAIQHKFQEAALNKNLKSIGGRARVRPYELELEMCAGHEVVIGQYRYGNTNALNVRVNVPGCHDDYDGTLGHLYQCRFDKTRYSAKLDHESYHVESLTTRKGLDLLAACPKGAEYNFDTVLKTPELAPNREAVASLLQSWKANHP